MATSEGPPKPKLRERLRIWREKRKQRDAERAQARRDLANSASDHRRHTRPGNLGSGGG
jgi:hypothetical protein